MGTAKISTGTGVQGETCHDLLNGVEASEFSRIGATKRGRVAAGMTGPPTRANAAEGPHGFLRGTVQVAPEVEPTAQLTD